MAVHIHPTAVVDRGAELATSVTVGPYAVIGPQVVIGEDCEIGATAHIAGPTRMGRGNRVYAQAAIGFDPQDLKYQGERTFLEIGDGNTFREFSTVHRGTGLGGFKTVIGSRNLFMAYCHVAHDCIVGNDTIFANAGTLAGHVQVGDGATIGAFAAVHQFCRVGSHAYVAGYSIVNKDALPFMKTVGMKPACYGVNRIGLERKGFAEAVIADLEEAERLLVRGKLNTAQAVTELRRRFPDRDEVVELVDFVTSSKRGVIRARPGRQGSRGRSE